MMASLNTLLVSREIGILCYLCGMTVRIWCFNAHDLRLYDVRKPISAFRLLSIYTSWEETAKFDVISPSLANNPIGKVMGVPISQFFFFLFFETFPH